MPTIITTLAKSKTLKARAGIKPLATVTGMAFGDGAFVNDTILLPGSGDNQLKHELLRKAIDSIEIIHDTDIQYICVLAKNELANSTINECALYDSDGDLICIRSFLPKGKDDDIEMKFAIDDLY